MSRTLIIAGLVATIAAGAGAYGWHAWDTGLIPGNPRAPLKENFEAAVLAALKLAPPEDTLCHHTGFRGWRGEDNHHNGIQNLSTQGVFGITLVPELGGEQRIRQIELLQSLAKAGYFSEKDTTFVDESGTSRAAKRFQLTLNGWYRLGSSDCLMVGQRGFTGITKTSKLETNDGTSAYEVVYEMKVRDLPAWATDAKVEGQFRQLKSMTEAIERKAKLVRTKEGWDARLARLPPPNEPQNASAPTVYLDLQSQPKVPNMPSLAEATAMIAGAPDGYSYAKLACLMLPQQHAADAVGDVANQDRERPYYATYYDDPAKSPAINRPRADGLGLMRALQSLRMVEEDLAPDTIINGMRFAGGATFRLKQQYKVLLDPRRPGCLPIAAMTPEVKAMRWRTMQQGTAEPIYHVELTGVAKATELRSWVKESGADTKLPMVKWLIEEGLPYAGQIRYSAKEGWQVSTGVVPNIQYVTDEKPAALFAALPRFAGRMEAVSTSEAHAIVVYEGRGPILVTVTKTPSPVELFLSSQRAAQWRLQLEPGARLKRVVAVGNEPQQVVGLPPGVTPEGNQSMQQRGAMHWLPFPGSQQQMGMVTERLSAMTTAPVKTIQTAYTGTQFRVSQDGKPVVANNPSYAVPGAVPYGYPGSPLPAVRAGPGPTAIGVGIPIYPDSMGRQMIQGGASVQAAPALAPAPVPAPRSSTPAPTPKLGMARCGSSTIVCQAGAETAMCNGQPVPCR